MKKLFFLACLFVGCACFTACGGEDDPVTGGTTIEDSSVSLEPGSVSVTAAGGTFTVNVKTSAKEWTAFATDDCASWVKATPNAQNGTITVVVSANGTDASREGTVTYKSGANRKSVTIVQDAPITVDPASVFFTADGGTQDIAVNTKSQWTATASADWVSCKNNSGKLNITVAENSGAFRTATVTIATADEKAEVEVKQDGTSAIETPDGYHLLWNDEFTEGTELNTKYWTHEVKNAGWVNNEKQNYVNGKSPKGTRVTEIKEGALRINCFKEDNKVYSARVYANLKTGYKYGWIEAKIKLPKGKGTWPAWWMMPVTFTSWPHCGEIDIMEEVGADPNQVSSSIHCTAYNHTKNTQKTHAMNCPGAEGEFHVYALEWTEDYIQTYVDGKKQLYFPNDKKNNDDTWPFHVPFYPILNLAWGGDWGGYKGVDESALPCTMEVDYVRIFEKN